MSSGDLWKKSATKAATALPNVASGAVSLAAATALWNPLPIILWGLGSAAWVFFASTSRDYARRVQREEERLARERSAAERAALCARLTEQLREEPIRGWVQRGLFPDYLRVYARLVEMAGKVEKISHDRTEFDFAAELGIQRQLESMLGAFLLFVRARLTYLQILGGKHGAPHAGAGPDKPLRLTEVDQRIAVLEAGLKAEPETANARQWHIEILVKQRELLIDCGKRDQAAAAQLQAFPDAFEVILGRVSASQLSPGDVEGYLTGLMQQVEETATFVEALRPAMDELLSPAGDHRTTG